MPRHTTLLKASRFGAKMTLVRHNRKVLPLAIAVLLTIAAVIGFIK